MTLTDIIIGQDKAVEDRVQHIFSAFQKEFPKARYDEREEILGIGEDGKYLLCYFKKEPDNAVYVKFKSNPFSVPVMEAQDRIDFFIRETVTAFKVNDFTKKRRMAKQNAALGENPPSLSRKQESRDVEQLFQKVLQITISKHGELVFEELASNRLTNALARGGIRRVADLSDWTATKLKGLHFFGLQCWDELVDVLEALKRDSFEKGVSPSFMDLLHQVATKQTVELLARSTEADGYLNGLAYDETAFEAGSNGYILCLTKKYENGFCAKFAADENELTQIYLENQDGLEQFLSKTKELFAYFISQLNLTDRDKEALALRLGLQGNEKTLEEVGAVFEFSRERARQITTKGINRMKKPFKLFSEAGRAKDEAFRAYLEGFSACSVDAFMAYLQEKDLNVLLDAFKKVVLSRVQCPQDLNERLETLKRLNKKKQTKKTPAKQKEPAFIVDENGEVQTDLELFEKLREWRLRKAREQGLDAYMVFSNKTLIELATYLPMTKEACLKINGIGLLKWECYGEDVVQIVVEHCENR